MIVFILCFLGVMGFLMLIPLFVKGMNALADKFGIYIAMIPCALVIAVLVSAAIING